jgi:hypothetical protein
MSSRVRVAASVKKRSISIFLVRGNDNDGRLAAAHTGRRTHHNNDGAARASSTQNEQRPRPDAAPLNAPIVTERPRLNKPTKSNADYSIKRPPPLYPQHYSAAACSAKVASAQALGRPL